MKPPFNYYPPDERDCRIIAEHRNEAPVAHMHFNLGETITLLKFDEALKEIAKLRKKFEMKEG